MISIRMNMSSVPGLAGVGRATPSVRVIMKIPSAKTRRDMEIAAELRAAGATWETAAEKLGRRRFVVQRWAKDYPDEWERLLGDAEQRVSREGTNESRSAMRILL